jgi:nitrate/nitrite-specific signal transduction histidine kinase
VAVTLNAPYHLPALPAAVEVAAYRIVTEAMTNAVRHSGAGRIEITLGVTDGTGLSIEVCDDGTGPPADWQPGVGVTSVHRAQDRGQPHLGHFHQAADRRPGEAIILARDAGLGRTARGGAEPA